MKLLRPLAVLAVLGLLTAPEIARYRAERRLGYATAAFRALLDRPGEADAAASLLELGRLAGSTTEALPGDPRPWILVGSSHLVTGQPVRALEGYREALATGERAEIDLNLGRAYAMAKRPESASAAFLRAGWISPEILAAIPDALAAPVRVEVSRLERELYSGRLAAPPPLPAEDRR